MIIFSQVSALFGPFKTLGCESNRAFSNLSIVAYIWASERIKNKGIVSFITPGSLLANYDFETFRKKFEKEFNDIYALNLRGDKQQDKSKEFREREGDPIFPPEGGVSGKAIIFLVKNPNCNHKGEIHYIATEDYATQEEKFEFLTAAKQTEPEWNEWFSSCGDPWNDKDNETAYLPLARLKKDKTDAKFTIFSVSSADICPSDKDVTFASNKIPLQR